jgi:NhaP-type Na+/H+ or K+/H+ antiporter
MAALQVLTALSILLLIGIILTYFSRRLKVPNVLALIIAGIFLGPIQLNGVRTFEFSTEFLAAVSIIALIMIVFDSTSRLPLRGISKDTTLALETTGLFLVAELVIFSTAAHFIANLSWFLSILLASILVGTDTGAVLVLLKNIKHKTITFLEVESIINTPLTVIIPFMVIGFAETFDLSTLLYSFIEQIAPFSQQIVTGVGAGMVVALITFRMMRKQYSQVLSPLVLIASALLTYILAESLGGNGVLAVTTLGLFFGNVSIKKKETLHTFGSLLSNLFEILVFLLLGVSIRLPTTVSFYIMSMMLFIVYIAIRTGVIFALFKKSKVTNKEKTFMSLNTAKGVAVGVVAFSLIPLSIGAELVIELALIFILYSIVLSTIVTHFSKYFIGAKIKPEK